MPTCAIAARSCIFHTGAEMGLFAVADFDADETVQNADALAFGKGKKEISDL